MNSLVLMACSGTKRDVASPAMDLYQGVMYETFRAHVKQHARPNVIILSARHGFVNANDVLMPYEQKMSESRASEMMANLPCFMDNIFWPSNVESVFLAGGQQYRRVMKAAVALKFPDVRLDECSGGIGLQRSQLGHYLDHLSIQRGQIIGRHPNGVPVFQTLGDFEVNDDVLVQHKALPGKPPRAAVIEELFDGPSGPTASVKMLERRFNRDEVRWVGLQHLTKMSATNSFGHI